MSKATAVAPSNIAFIKYWGARDLERAIPANASISMTLSACVSKTTVEHRTEATETVVRLLGDDGSLTAAPRGFALAVERHLDALAATVGAQGSFTVATSNSFPSAAGIASSASGFAALALAAAGALGTSPPPETLSIWARASGSGSAARSVLGGYVEWPGDASDPESPARQLAAAAHWPLCDVVAVVDAGPKAVSSRDGHRRAASSPYYLRRQELLGERLTAVRQAIEDRDLDSLGATLEAEAIDLHLIAMSSDPPIHYWQPGTLSILTRVRELRADGVAVYATMDAGPNVHLICEPGGESDVVEAIGALAPVDSVIRDRVGTGPELVEEHLF
jgi:diphosphomevalonate decarboxylase